MYSPALEGLTAAGRAAKGPADVVSPCPKEHRVRLLSYPLLATPSLPGCISQMSWGQEGPSQGAILRCGQVMGLPRPLNSLLLAAKLATVPQPQLPSEPNLNTAPIRPAEKAAWLPGVCGLSLSNHLSVCFACGEMVDFQRFKLSCSSQDPELKYQFRSLEL